MNDIQPCKDGCGFTFSSSTCDGDSSMLEDSLLSLLRQPLLSTDFAIPSFADPFSDPKMEPLPLRKQVTKAHQNHQPQHQTGTNLHDKMTFLDDHSVSSGSKIGSQDVISKHDDDDCSLTSSDHQSLIHVADSIARSFEDPFADPEMEPLPLREEATKAHQVHQVHQSQPQSDANFGKKMTLFDNDIVVAGNKRGSQDSVSQYDDDDEDGSLTSSDHHSLSHVADNIARFRPYQDKKWKGSFQRLLKFKHEFGHCCVPNAYAEDPALARWVTRQRHQYRKFENNDRTSTLTASRLEQLESVGFVWHSHAATWLEKLNEIKHYKQQTGHCNVPSNYPEKAGLATWVKSQRRQYKLRVSGLKSTMTTDRIRVLKELGFVFEPRLTLLKTFALISSPKGMAFEPKTIPYKPSEVEM